MFIDRSISYVFAPLMLVLGGFLVACSDGLTMSPVYHPDGFVVRYEVVSSCEAFVTLSTPSGTVQHEIGAAAESNPWWFMRTADVGDSLIVMAQVGCWDGVITTRILRWDAFARYGDEPGWYVWAQNTSRGDFVISTTNGVY